MFDFIMFIGMLCILIEMINIRHALKAKGLANGLSSMTYTSMSDFATFRVHIELTDDGIKHTNDIISCVFAYIGKHTHLIRHSFLTTCSYTIY